MHGTLRIWECRITAFSSPRVGFTVECSNIEPDPFHADTPLEAARCGLRNDLLITKTTLALDGGGRSRSGTGASGRSCCPGRVVVPENGVFGGTPGEIMRFGGHGYVALIRPLPVGVHTLQLRIEGPEEILGIPPAGIDATTTITVTR